MKITRFEKKILGILLLVATTALVSAWVFSRSALREAYQIGVNSKVGDELTKGLDLHRKYIQTLKADIHQQARLISHHSRVQKLIALNDWLALTTELEEQIQSIPSLVSVQLKEDQNTIVVSVKKPSEASTNTHRFSLIGQPIDSSILKGDAPQLEFQFAIPLSVFENYQLAGEVEQLYSRLRKSRDYISNRYVTVFIGFLAMTILVISILGLVLTRRVTRRVTDLASALRRVGEGDLDIEVPVTSNDEIGILTKSFNQMIKDLRESQNRVAYLQRINAWQQFARRLAHEIKNPLTPIQLAAQQIEHSYHGTDKEHQRKLSDAKHIIEEEVATLRALVSEFSAFAKLPEVQLAQADLNVFIQELQPTFEAAVEDTKALFPNSKISVELRLELSKKKLFVEMDAMMLKRCMDNLLRNALESIFNDEQKNQGQVTISTKIENSKIHLSVKDNGAGIDPSDIQHIFDPYFTTKSHGTGLGLPIVKKIILEHRGEISCSSKMGIGSEFQILLPLLKKLKN